MQVIKQRPKNFIHSNINLFTFKKNFYQLTLLNMIQNAYFLVKLIGYTIMMITVILPPLLMPFADFFSFFFFS